MKEFVLVFVGGGLGSMLRYAFTKVIKPETGLWSWPTLSANLLACFILGSVTGFLLVQRSAKGWETPLLMAGFCGGLSTFSTLIAELQGHFTQSHYSKLFFYLLVSLVLGWMVFVLGLKTAQWLTKLWI
jgi:fluoride exporter